MTAAAWFQRWSDWIFDQAELLRIGADLRLRAEAKPRILQGVICARDQTDRFMDVGRFVVEVQDAMESAGLPCPDNELLRRIWGFAVSISQGYAVWRSQQNEVSLQRAPACELIAVFAEADMSRARKRWVEAGGVVRDGDRMVAPRTSEIWCRLSDFNLPWPPFSIGCGLGLRSIRAREAAGMGIEADGQELQSGWWDVTC